MVDGVSQESCGEGVSQESRLFGEMGWQLDDERGRPAWYEGRREWLGAGVVCT